MPPHPEDESCILPMPAAPTMPSKKRPRLFIILVPHQHPHPCHLAAIPAANTGPSKHRGAAGGKAPAFIFLPDDGKEEGASAVHDRYIGKFPVAIIGDEGFDYKSEEGVVRDRSHSIIGNARWLSSANPGGV